MQLRGYVLAPKATIENKKPILYMYREKPDNIYDTGWRFFSGYESDEYVNDPENIGIYDISTITDIYPNISPYLSLPTDSFLERDNKDSDFHLIREKTD